MAEFNRLPFWTDAYLADTTHLTTTEHGAYLLLLIAMWRTRDKSLPRDDKMLARYAKLTSGQWARMRATILAFFQVDGDRIRHGRLTATADAVRRISRSQSDNAKAKYRKNRETTHPTAKPEFSRITPSESESNPPSLSPPKRKRAGAVLPTDWQPDQRTVDYARTRHLSDADFKDALANFRAYFGEGPGRNKTYSNWDRALEVWIRRERLRDRGETPSPVREPIKIAPFQDGYRVRFLKRPRDPPMSLSEAEQAEWLRGYDSLPPLKRAG